MYNESLHRIALFEVCFEIEKELKAKGLSKHFYDVVPMPRNQKNLINRYVKQKVKVYEELSELGEIAEKEFGIDLKKYKCPLSLDEDKSEGSHV